MIPALAVCLAAAPAIDVYTMGQGAHLFERFGHAAICVVFDAAPAKTRCYNYGTTDFASPPQQLGWEFLRGTARFWVSVWPQERMLAAYARADRAVWRQRLPLDAAATAAIRERLEHDAREENRYYVYHHFHDNCSTRVRDVIDVGTDFALRRGAERSFGATHRELGRAGLAELTPVLVASDFVVGRRADAPLTTHQAMFLPRVLREELRARFGAEPELVYRRQGPDFPTTGPSGRVWVTLFALALGAVAWLAARFAAAARWLLVIPALLLGALAGSLWFVAALSTVAELRWNEALLLFWPTDLVLPLLGPSARVKYAAARAVSIAVVALGLLSGLLRQPLDAPLLLPAALFLPLLFPSLGRWAVRGWARRGGAPPPAPTPDRSG